MLKAFSWLVAILLLGGCYSQYKATKQVSKALANYPQIVARIALDSFPCDVIRIDTIITVRDSIVECLPIENFTTLSQIDTIYGTKKVFVRLPIKTSYITRIVESTAKLTIINVQLDSVNNVIRELQKSNDELSKKIANKNKAIWWFIALVVGLLLPYVIHIFKLLNIKI
jgi:PBP1b-binding outer membrane lipoprotein LpoB